MNVTIIAQLSNWEKFSYLEGKFLDGAKCGGNLTTNQLLYMVPLFPNYLIGKSSLISSNLSQCVLGRFVNNLVSKVMNIVNNGANLTPSGKLTW